MGMNLEEIEQTAFEAGWEAALVAAALAVQRSGTGLPVSLFEAFQELAGSPPEYTDDADT